MRQFMNILLIMLLIAMTVWLGGCGALGGLNVLDGTSNSASSTSGGNLTGGSIPIGGDIGGRVYKAQALTPVADAAVQLLTASGNVNNTQVTGADGSFIFTHVPQGHWNLQVKQGKQVVNMPVVLDSNPISVSVVVENTPMQITQLQVQPAGPAISLNLGDTLAFQAAGIDVSGSAHTVAASWLMHGPVGTISPTGIFTATQAGTGTVTATYQHHSAFVQITVTAPGKH